MNAIENITIGRPERLCKPVGCTMLANLVNIIPFCLSVEAVRIIFAHSTAAANRSIRRGCGAFSAYRSSICWRWLWPNGPPTGPISEGPTK